MSPEEVWYETQAPTPDDVPHPPTLALGDVEQRCRAGSLAPGLAAQCTLPALHLVGTPPPLNPPHLKSQWLPC